MEKNLKTLKKNKFAIKKLDLHHVQYECLQRQQSGVNCAKLQKNRQFCSSVLMNFLISLFFSFTKAVLFWLVVYWCDSP